jgi:hypothetical protein
LEVEREITTTFTPCFAPFLSIPKLHRRSFFIITILSLLSHFFEKKVYNL